MLLIGNGRLLTRDQGNYIENGAVAIEGNLILEVGETPS
jgi:cytosine/adenosine deaminase-related metal-dependent hydrolase